MDKMRVAVMDGKREVSLKSTDIPVPKDNEVLIKVDTVGVCGSDLHYYSQGKIGDMIVETPFILGHECAGVIVDIGKNVQNLSIGDKVAVEPGVPCGKCEFCLHGKYNLCSDLVFMATPPDNGCLMDYIVYPSQWVFKIPDNMSFAEGALIEPLAVGMHAVAQAQADIGKSALIFGAGCIGLVTLLTLKSRGITNIYIVDMIDSRLDKAKELGATETINVKNENVNTIINKLTDDKGVDMVFEMTGSPQAILQTVKTVKKGGTIICVGLGSEKNVSFDLGGLIWKEATLKTVFRYRNLYPSAIEAVSKEIIPVKEIISHIYNLEDISEALEYHVNCKNDIIKMIIKL